jgi:hypothetical protein
MIEDRSSKMDSWLGTNFSSVGRKKCASGTWRINAWYLWWVPLRYKVLDLPEATEVPYTISVILLNIS